MKVLIVEDEVAYVEALRIALDAEGIDTVAALDGREAIKAARADQYDAILLDLMLPSVGGLDVLRAVRKTSQVPGDRGLSQGLRGRCGVGPRTWRRRLPHKAVLGA